MEKYHPKQQRRFEARRLIHVVVVPLFALVAACTPSDEGPSADPAFMIQAPEGDVGVTLADTPVSVDVGVALERIEESGGAVDVSVSDLPHGVTASPVTVPAGEAGANLTLVFAPDTAQGTSSIAIEATDGTTTDSTSVEAFVRGAPGTFDTTFGDGGHVVHEVNAKETVFEHVAVQPDGKILRAARVFDGTANALTVTRLHEDGTIDETYGVDGSVSHVSSDLLYVRDIIHHDGDAYVLYADSVDDGVSLRLIPKVARFDDDGTLDGSYGTNGIATIDVADDHYFHSLAVDASDRILIGGAVNFVADNLFAVARLTTGGILDPSFGDAGLASQLVEEGNAGYDLVVLPDGDIVVAGDARFGSGTTATYEFAAVRFDSDGSLATDFGDAGAVTHDFPGEDEAAYAIVLQGEKLVLGGGNRGLDADLASMLRLNLDGTLDPTFGNDGAIQFDSGTGRDNILRLAVQSDGKLVAAGESWDDEDKRILIFRTTPDGDLDTSPEGERFTSDGYVRATVDGIMWPTFSDMILLPDDSVLTSGTLYDTEAATYAGGFAMKHWR